MATLSRSDFAREAAVSKQAVSKAVARGQLVVDAAGLVDPAHLVNARWLGLHRAGFARNGRPMASQPARTGRGEAALPPSPPSGRNGPSAGSAAAEPGLPSVAELKTSMARLAERNLDDLL